MATSGKRRYSVSVIQETLLLPGRCYSTHPITIGPFCSRNDPKGSWGKIDGRYASGLFLQLPVRGCGSAAILGTQPFNYCYLRTTTEAMAHLYRLIVRREDRIPQSEWSDYTLVCSQPATQCPCEQCQQLSLSVLGLIRGPFG